MKGLTYMKFIKYLFSKEYRNEYSKNIIDKLFDMETETDAIYSALFQSIAA
jgi:hypothetical protein